MKEFTLETKHDTWIIPEDTRILRVNCKLGMHSAQKIIEKCRELEKVVFAGHAFALTEPEVIQYLNTLVFVMVTGKVVHHGVSDKTADKIRELYITGGHTIPSLAQDFNLSENVVWHVVNERAPTHAEEKS